jgi:hypothetical protein
MERVGLQSVVVSITTNIEALKIIRHTSYNLTCRYGDVAVRRDI